MTYFIIVISITIQQYMHLYLVYLYIHIIYFTCILLYNNVVLILQTYIVVSSKIDQDSLIIITLFVKIHDKMK